jgi:hypothetical protein
LHDLEHILRRDLGDRDRPDLRGVNIEGYRPLGAMLCIPPAARFRGEQRVGALPERHPRGRGAAFGLPRLQGIEALRQRFPHSSGDLARLRKC